ncbi:MAG: hypothetical protein GY708_21735, partial [Actinomycetia bacterium]|nr:hypothetical protein [Actinomycetes bacterium]
VSDTYAIEYHLDDLQVLGRARLYSANSIVVHGTSGSDVMVVGGLLGTPSLDLGSVETLDLTDGQLEIRDFAGASLTSLSLDNSTVTMSGVVSIPTVTLSNNSLLRHGATTTTTAYGLDLTVDSLTIASGSRIDVSNRGYLGGYRSGNTANGDAHPDGVEAGTGIGGSYGGLGGKASASASYGDFRAPFELGGGGDGNSTSRPGGNGGGRVHIVANSLTVDGQILSNGQDVASNDVYASGGAGGAIWIETTTLSGTGEIAADGGSPLYNTGNAYSAGGGG